MVENVATDHELQEREHLLTEGAYGYNPASPVKKNIQKGKALQRRHSGPEAIGKRSGPVDGMDCDDESTATDMGLQEFVATRQTVCGTCRPLRRAPQLGRCRIRVGAVPAQLPLHV